MGKQRPKKDWIMEPESFERFLRWLDREVGSDGERYIEIRRRLVSYFDRKNCRTPEDLADETLNRVARRLEEEGRIDVETPEKYCYITAKFVFLESLRSKEKQNVAIDPAIENKLISEVTGDENENEIRFECLEKCADKLEVSNREIIFRYYYGEERIKIENRRMLAQKFELSVNALSIRACRIREKLRGCVKKCVDDGSN